MVKNPFNTGGRQYKQAIGTHVKVDHDLLKEVKITVFYWEKTGPLITDHLYRVTA